MAPFAVCDDVLLWGVRTAAEAQEECIICVDYAHIARSSPRQMRYLCRQKRMHMLASDVSSASSASSVIGADIGHKEKTTSPGLIRERHRMEVYQRQVRQVKAQSEIKALIDNKRREDFVPLREALYLVYTYSGPYLQKPGDKKKAACFLRRKGYGAMFVKAFDDSVKWKWLESQVSGAEITTTSRPFVR
ncbi:hypothetical protein DFH28DRAFT_925492 [Melampsora americana]|nr:hypothetical protein DFH28DRAFT_890963 [Melampsora americana]KAH9818701.1 hypothetical protein DFH28DRAFT_925492 [Melampsora americana]